MNRRIRSLDKASTRPAPSMRWLIVGLVAVAALAGCATPPPTDAAVASPSPSTAAAGQSSTCTSEDGATASYAPSTTSAFAQTIKSRGFLVVGVSADTRLLGAVKPSNPNTFEGFDIDIATRVAQSIFGAKDVTKNLRFKVISAADRIPQLQKDVNSQDIASGGVDMVTRAFTITCARWKQISFSAVYFNATQKILVPVDNPATSVTQLKSGSKICAPVGSTSLDTIQKSYKQFVAVGVANHTDCLALFQQGKVDAITGDDAILAGFQSQDQSSTKVLTEPFGSPQPYGIGLPKSHPDFVQFVNAVLEQMRTDGSWQAAYDAWLKGPLKVSATEPAPTYGRAVGS